MQFISNHITRYVIRKGIPLLFIFFVSSLIRAQSRWDGEGGDARWNNPLNWENNIVPGAADEVLLDNSLVPGNYEVYLPAGASPIMIRAISIAPASSNSIQLILPVSNTGAPAFITVGHIDIYKGGIFINASSLTSGPAIQAGDSIRIYNNGHYIHRTRASHSAMVGMLSKLPGTEYGIFEFDVPGGPYTFTAANRTYGILLFNALASGGSQIYNTIGSNPLHVNGDFIINNGVTVNLDLANDLFIDRHFIQYGGLFNVAAQSNNTVLYIKGDINQQGGVITETATGFPAIELNGTVRQQVTISGSITNSVSFRLNNEAGAGLLTDVLLPFNLTLAKGNIISNSFLLTLATGGTLTTDSASGNNFITGRLRKEGLSGTHFFFPVGKSITRRWMELKNATGNYTVEFIASSPRALSTATGTGIDHISGIEYWTIEADSIPTPAATIELSFDNVNSGGVTSLSSLRVAQLAGNQWEDAGNMATTGVVGSGSVISNHLSLYTQAATTYFTLATNEPVQNPLLLYPFSFEAKRTGQAIIFSCELGKDYFPAFIEWQVSDSGGTFVTVSRMKVKRGVYKYEYSLHEATNTLLCRLKLVEYSGAFTYSNAIRLSSRGPFEPVKYPLLKLLPSVVSDKAILLFNAGRQSNACITICDSYGSVVQQLYVPASKGRNLIPLQLQRLIKGGYILKVTGLYNEEMMLRFIKQ